MPTLLSLIFQKIPKSVPPILYLTGVLFGDGMVSPGTGCPVILAVFVAFVTMIQVVLSSLPGSSGLLMSAAPDEQQVVKHTINVSNIEKTNMFRDLAIVGIQGILHVAQSDTRR